MRTYWDDPATLGDLANVKEDVREKFEDLRERMEALEKKPTVKFKKLDPAAQIPKYQTPGSAGMDLTAVKGYVIWTDDYTVIETGLSIEIPPGFEAQVRSRSGLAVKHGLAVLNSPGTIDSDYRGEVKVILYNHGPHTYNVQPGDRIAQLVIAPVVQPEIEEVTDLTETERGEGGFGSTGVTS